MKRDRRLIECHALFGRWLILWSLVRRMSPTGKNPMEVPSQFAVGTDDSQVATRMKCDQMLAQFSGSGHGLNSTKIRPMTMDPGNRGLPQRHDQAETDDNQCRVLQACWCR